MHRLGRLSVAAVSIHAPAWGATTTNPYAAPVTAGFNPRARMGRDALATLDAACPELFQSTRPHGARRDQCSIPCCRSRVSIHAPAWGATSCARAVCQIQKVSIHAPAWGATQAQMHQCRDIDVFQSTRPHGARRRVLRAGYPDLQFQSTRPHGARHAIPLRKCLRCLFQSTRPHGARLPHHKYLSRLSIFNALREPVR